MPKKEALAVVLILLAISLFYFSFFAVPHAGKAAGGKYIDVVSESGVSHVSVELAQSAGEKLRGLMYRDYLPEGHGMLFVYDREDYYSFWMKNTRIPLDIIYISSDLRIVDIKRDFQPCTTQTCEVYAPKAAAMYVLEVNGGYAEKKGIGIGDSVKFSF